MTIRHNINFEPYFGRGYETYLKYKILIKIFSKFWLSKNEVCHYTFDTPPILGAGTTFYENTISFSRESVNTSCCLADLTTVSVTCGRGASCAAQCCALGATLCPSGVCSEDPDSCQAGLQEGSARARGEQDLKNYSKCVASSVLPKSDTIILSRIC